MKKKPARTDITARLRAVRGATFAGPAGYAAAERFRAETNGITADEMAQSWGDGGKSACDDWETPCV